MADLARRTLTIVVGIPLVVGWLWLADSTSSVWILVLPLVALTGVAASEYATLIDGQGTPLALRPFMIVSALSTLAYGLVSPTEIAWVLALGALMLAGAHLNRPDRAQATLAGMAGLVYLPLFLQFVIRIHEGPFGLAAILTLLALVWSYDSGAYLIGSRWGQRRLAPELSPKKSWEGTVGGLAVAGGVGLLSMLWLPWGGHGLILAGLVSLAAQIGDLFESQLKRTAGVKDAGALFPGHGGVLDRIDALLFALPVYHLYLVMVMP